MTSMRPAKAILTARSGTRLTTATPATAPGIAAAPRIAPSRRRTLPYPCWRQAPTSAIGMIASSDVASASTWPRPRKTVSAGTKSTPPPTPSSPARTPASAPTRTAAITAGGGRRPRRREPPLSPQGEVGGRDDEDRGEQQPDGPHRRALRHPRAGDDAADRGHA